MIFVASLALLLESAAPATSPALTRRLERRVEVEKKVSEIAAGQAPHAAVLRIRYLGEEAYAADLLVQELSRATPSSRRAIAEALGELADPAGEPALVRMTRDRDPVIRQAAAEGLGRMRSRNADALRPLLSDPILAVRRAAARSLGAMRNPRLGALLVGAAVAEGEPEVRAALLVAAGESGDRKVAPRLEGFLRSSSEGTRLAAAQALCRLGAPSGLAFARKQLASPDRYRRRDGVEVLAGAPLPVSRPLLSPLLEDKDRVLAAAAARVLYRAGDARMLDFLVLGAHRQASAGEGRAFEAELEALHVRDDERQRILSRAGIR